MPQATPTAESSPSAAPSVGGRFWPLLAILLLFAAAARALLVRDYTAHNPLAQAPLNDAEHYWNWAGAVADGRDFEPGPFFSSPLYPYVLGFYRATGGALPGVYLIQALFGVATAFLLARIAHRAGGALAGLLAAALFLLLAEAASAELRVLASSLQIFLVALTWTAAQRAKERMTPVAYAVAGALLGALCLADGTAVLVALALCMWFVVGMPRTAGWAAHVRRHGWRAALPLGVVMLVIAPATVHNWHASGGEFSLIRSGAGLNLRLGNQPQSEGVYTPLPGISTQRREMFADAARVYAGATGQPPTWGKVDRYFRDQTLSFWREQPARALQLALRKCYLFWTARNYADIYQPAAEVASGQNPWLRVAPLPTPWLLFVALPGLGLMCRARGRAAPALVLTLIPVLVVAVFFFSPRYRMPALPVAAVAAALAVARAVEWRRNGLFTVLVALAASAGPLTGVLNRASGIDPVDVSSAQFNRGAALFKLQRLDEAFTAWREGLHHNNSPVQRLALADALVAAGRPSEASEEYRVLLSAQPQSLDLAMRLGTVLMQLGRFAEVESLLARFSGQARALALIADAKVGQNDVSAALATYEQALRLAAGDAGIRGQYADLLGQLGRTQEALDQFAQVVAAAPGSVFARHRMGVLLAICGRLDEASVHLQRAAELDPRSVQILMDLATLRTRQGRTAEAVQILQRAAALDPKSTSIRAMLEKLGAAGVGRP